MNSADSALLAQLLGRPSWHREAACREIPVDDFFPERHKPATEAKAICSTCPVLVECLKYALEHNVQGIWGATSERQRRRLRREAS